VLGHQFLETTKETTKRIGVKLTGHCKQCENCMLTEINKKKIIKLTSVSLSKVLGEHVCWIFPSRATF
jgi:hypothetical protein